MRLTKLAVSGLKNQRGEYALAPLTIFSGPNGAGKTGALQAVMFGVAGYEPRLGKSAEKLAPLMNGDELSVRLMAENGGRSLAVTRTLTQKNGKLSHGIRVHPARGEETLAQLQARVLAEFGSFPVAFSLDEFLALSHDRRRAFLFALAGEAGGEPADVVAAALALMPPEAPAEVRAAAEASLRAMHAAARKEGAETAHDLVGRVVELLKAGESEAAAERKGRHAALQGLTDELAGLPAASGSAADLKAEVAALNGEADRARKELEVARAALQAYRRAAARGEEIGRAREALGADRSAEVEAARAGAAELQAAAEAEQAQLEALRGRAEEAARAYAAALEAAIEAGRRVGAAEGEQAGAEALLKQLGTCPLEADPSCCLRQRREALAAKESGLGALRKALMAAEGAKTQASERADGLKRDVTRATAALDARRAEAGTRSAALAALEREQAGREGRLRALAEEEATLADTLAAPPVTDLDVLQARLDGLRGRREAAQAAGLAVTKRETLEKALQEARAALWAAEAKGEALKALKLAVGPKGLQGDLARRAIEPLAAAANQVLGQLPAGKALAVRTVSDKGAEILDVGWERAGRLVAFETLSGGERVQFAAALAAGLLRLKAPPLRVLCVDDLAAVDAENRRPFVEALLALVLGGAVDNVLLASVEPIFGPEVPEGAAEYALRDGAPAEISAGLATATAMAPALYQ